MSGYYYMTDAQLGQLYARRPDARGMGMFPFSFEDQGMLLSRAIMEALDLTRVPTQPTPLQGIFRVMSLDPEVVAVPETPAATAETPDVVEAAPEVIDPAARLLAALRGPLAPLLARVGAVSVVTSDANPRSHGTGLRIVLATTGMPEARLPLSQTRYRDYSMPGFMGRMNVTAYEPTYHGQSLRVPGDIAQSGIPIAEMFLTQDGGIDLFLPLRPDTQAFVLARDPSPAEIQWLDNVLRAAEEEMVEQDRVRPETRDARFAEQEPAFVRFAREQIRVTASSSAQSIRQLEEQILESQQRYVSQTRELEQHERSIEALATHESNARAALTAAIERLDADPKVAVVAIRDNRVIITTREIQAYVVATEETMTLCPYQVSFVMDRGQVVFEATQRDRRHPALSGSRRGTSPIDLAIVESLTRHDLAGAWRQAMRFLQTIA